MKKPIIIVWAILSVLALFFISCIAINRIVIHGAEDIIEGNGKYEINKKYDAIVVLGASINPDGSPSNILNDRLRGAVELYKKGIAPKIIVSGDRSSDGYDEPASMKQYCEAHGVPTEDIIVDEKGYSTYESIHNVVNGMRIKSIIVVTQQYHTYRAVYTARKMGADADGFSTNYRDYIYFAQMQRDIREFGARIKDFFKVNFNN